MRDVVIIAESLLPDWGSSRDGAALVALEFGVAATVSSLADMRAGGEELRLSCVLMVVFATHDE